MGFLHVTILSATAFLISNLALIQCSRPYRGNPMVSSLLRNIMSPSSSNGGMQLLKMASGNRANPEIVMPSAVRPRSVLPNTILPTNAITQSNAMLQTNDIINNRMTAHPKMVPQGLAPKLVNPQFEVARRMPVQQIEVARRVPVTSQIAVETGPCPAPLINPFLPAASPVSALAPPTSNLLPPANINNPKCTFLRKIPIPPPTL